MVSSQKLFTTVLQHSSEQYILQQQTNRFYLPEAENKTSTK